MPVHLVYMSQDTLQKIYNTTQSGSLDPLFFIHCTVNNSRVNNNDGIISRWDRTEKTHLIKSNNFERYILDEMVDAKDEWD